MKIFDYEKKILEPKRATKWSAGYDIRAKDEEFIESGSIKIIKTGVKINSETKDWFQIRDSYFMALHIRSSLALKGLRLANGVGVIDMDYPDEIGVIIENISIDDITIIKEERIAQLVITRCYISGEAEEDIRYSGFGSSGTN